MKTFIAFLQTSFEHGVRLNPGPHSRLPRVQTPVPMTDKLTCAVEAKNMAEAIQKLKRLVAKAYRGTPEGADLQSVTLVSMIQLNRIPAAGLMLHQETIISLPSLICPIQDQRGAKEVALGKDIVIWER